MPPDNTPTLIGAIGATIAGIGGLIVGARRNRTDDMTAIVAAALAVSDRNAKDADRNAGEAHDCLERLAAQDRRLDAMEADLHACNERHARAEEAMRAAGLDLD